MSKITNVLLLVDGLPGEALTPWLEEIGQWRHFERRFPLASLEATALPPLWYGGDRPLTGGMALGALNNLELDPYLAFLRRLPWDEHGRAVQLAVKEQDADGFRLYPIYPLERAAPDPERERALATMKSYFGELVVTDFELPELPAGPLEPLDEACLRYLATRGYRFSPERT
ncbi:MAG: hypothetical protein JWM80_5564 [Cyanobacteria bacterium RYN_339]|nr:hypothetical protein [Cyanobacteria bacterium RYN_339]